MERIVGMSDRQAHVVLLALCDDFATRQRALSLLDNLETRELGANGMKRKAPDDELVCAQCSEIFLEEDNNSTACWYHDGK